MMNTEKKKAPDSGEAELGTQNNITKIYDNSNSEICQENNDKKVKNLSSSMKRYYWYKEHGICVKCGQQPAWKGQTLCLECRFKNLESTEKSHRKRRNKYLSKMRESHVKRYKECREKGICVKCGKRKAAEGKVMCGICLSKARACKIAHRKEGTLPRSLLGNGVFCSFCGSYTNNGEKLCPKCYQNNLKKLEKAREALAKKKAECKTIQYDWRDFPSFEQKEENDNV